MTGKELVYILENLEKRGRITKYKAKADDDKVLWYETYSFLNK